MPYTFASSLPTISGLTIDQLHVTEIDVLTPLPSGVAAPPSLRVYYAVVHRDPSGALRVIETSSVTLDATKLAAAMADGTKTMYANIKGLVYQALAGAMPSLPAGTVS